MLRAARNSLSHAWISITMKGEEEEEDAVKHEDAIKHEDIIPIFSEMSELCEEGEEMEWRESARWLQQEEFVLDGDDLWSEPRVPALSLQSLLELREQFLGCALLLDLKVTSLEDMTDTLLDDLVSTGAIPEDAREEVWKALLSKRRQQLQGGNASPPTPQSLSGISRKASGCELNSTCFVERRSSKETIPSPEEAISLEDLNGEQESNIHLLTSIPPETEACHIFVGELDFLEDIVAAFIRLEHSTFLDDISKIPVPSRFLFILLGPKGELASLRAIGCALATLCTEEEFCQAVLSARERQHLLTAVDNFLNSVTVLPPGSKPLARRKSISAAARKEPRKRKLKRLKSSAESRALAQKVHEEAGLTKTNRLFGGLIRDLQRKMPWYMSDWKDAFASQCIASWLFLYIASLLPLIMFGEVLGEATGKNMAAMECLMGGCVCGVLYGVFSGQPVILVGTTASVLSLESMVYEFCRMMEWHYLSFRLWIGVWMAIILFVLVALDAAYFACYVTRFTEESFAAIIDFSFMQQAVQHLMKVRKRFPMIAKTGIQLGYNCICMPKYANASPIMENWANLTSENCVKNNGTLSDDGCFNPNHTQDVFVMSVVLSIGTFFIILQLKDFKMSFFLSAKMRQLISEFAVTIAMLLMIFFDSVVGSSTPKVELQPELKPTLPGRSWLVPPLAGNPFWSVLLAVLPAMFCTTLVFTDQQITTIIVNRKENKLRKGCGYHLDLCVLAVLTFICSVMGLPWFTAATVLSVNHVKSLKVESDRNGQKVRFVGVREQRVTPVVISVTLGLSVLITPLLRRVPMPVLYGMFLYSGMVGFKGLQLFNRITIMFMTRKYHPDNMYLRRLPLRRVHLYTAIQLACILMLWLINTFQHTGLLVPVALGLCIWVRKGLEYLFTPLELDVLDNVLPEFMMRQEEDQWQLEQNEDLSISLANGHLKPIPLVSQNASDGAKETDFSVLVTHADELSPSSVCKQNRAETIRIDSRRGSKRDSLLEDELQALSTTEPA